jgi:tetratricopeptide (TPR) repeat protein
MAGGAAKLLNSYQYVLVGRFNIAPLARVIARRFGADGGIAAHFCHEAQGCANRGQYEAGIRACRASIAIKRDHLPAYEVRVQILTHLRRYEEALEVCAEALEVAPNSEAISSSIAQVLPAIGHTQHPEWVIAILNRCSAANPRLTDVLMSLVNMLLKLGNYRELVRVCRRVLEIDPEFVPAVDALRSLLADPNAQQALGDLKIVPSSEFAEEYDWLVASNMTDALIEVMSKFYTRIGIDPFKTPLVQGLHRFREKLSANAQRANQQGRRPPLVLFEAAWQQHRSGKVNEAREAFSAIFYDSTARTRAAHNPVLKEALVRSGEILGRYYDNIGEVERAIGVYRDIMSIDQNGLIARRLMLLLSRAGHLREAAAFGETAIISRANLFRSIPPNPYMASLKGEIALVS